MSEKLARKAVEDLLKYRTSIRTLLPISTEDTRQKVSSSSNENIQSLHKTSKTINKNTKLPPTKTGLKKIKDKKRREAMLAAIEHRKEEKGRVNPLEQIRKEKETRKFNLKHNLNYFKSSQLESIKEKELKKKACFFIHLIYYNIWLIGYFLTDIRVAIEGRKILRGNF